MVTLGELGHIAQMTRECSSPLPKGRLKIRLVQLARQQAFCFVSGHDFSRAVKAQRE